tara:strand:+ start:112 stop:699 length:588 start_codon:yes stop_codon:yes gene_type:complete
MYKSEEIVLIDCEFVDETGKASDTTPVFWHIDPKTPVDGDGGMDTAQRASLEPILQSLSDARGKGGLKKLTDMTFEDFFPFLDPTFAVNGEPPARAFDNDVAWFGYLTVDEPNANPPQFWNKPPTETDPNDPNPQNHWDMDGQCSYKKNTHQYRPHHTGQPLIGIIPLPPCEDPMGFAAKAKALEYVNPFSCSTF